MLTNEEKPSKLHPSFDKDLLSSSCEKAAAAFIYCGDLSVDSLGRVWRHKKKVGGIGYRFISVSKSRADREIRTKSNTVYRQIQVYILGVRIVCSVHRLVWFLHNGEIPNGYHIHHINEESFDNRIENLDCIDGSSHIAKHSIGKTPPNKGTLYGETEAYKKALCTRRTNYDIKVQETKRLFENGVNIKDIANTQNICVRQVYTRLSRC